MLCRKLKTGFFTIFFFGQDHSQAALPAFFFFFFLSWYPELILTINVKSKRQQTRCSQQPVFFFQEGCANKEVEG